MNILLDTKQTVAALTLPSGKSDYVYWDTVMPCLGYRIRASGVRGYIFQYRFEGQSRRKKIKATDPARARELVDAMKANLANSIDPVAEKKAELIARTLTFGKVAAEYLEGKKAELRPSSFRQCKAYLTGDNFKPLHSKPLNKITRGEVSSCTNKTKAASGAAAARVAYAYGSAFFVWCMTMGYAEANPFVGSVCPDAGPSRERTLSDAELTRVWACCKDDDYGRVLRLLILTGCRRSEVGDLKWSEVDFDTGLLRLQRTKNGRKHEVPLTSMALEILHSIPERVGREYVFGSRGTGFNSWAQGKTALGDGIEERWTAHDLRRTFRSGLGRLRVPPHIAELAINHAQKGMVGVYDRYGYETEIAAAFALWHDHVAIIVDGSERKVIAFPHSA